MADYALITPAHNEQDLIEKTIQSVVQQTARPLRWIIVNDASADGTAAVVARYCREYDFIRLINVERPNGRSFGGKVGAFNRGLAELADLPWAFIGNLDADISLRADYYKGILREFEKDPRLGIAGGMVH